METHRQSEVERGPRFRKLLASHVDVRADHVRIGAVAVQGQTHSQRALCIREPTGDVAHAGQ